MDSKKYRYQYEKISDMSVQECREMIEDALTQAGVEMANPSLGHSNMHIDN